MNEYKWKAYFKSDFLSGSCDGEIKAVDADEAEMKLVKFVASDLKINQSDITKIELTKV